MMNIFSPTTVVSPDGDVVLVIGEEKKRVKVSSMALSLGSLVFKAMFTRHFKEYHELTESISPYELPLPDDLPEPMIILCKILHFRHEALPVIGQKEIPLLADFAQACDKYDCIKAVSFVTAVWLDKLVQYAREPGSKTLVAIAFLLDSPKAFTAITKELVLHSHPGTCLTLNDFENQVPVSLWARLHMRSIDVYSVLKRLIQADIARMTSGNYATTHELDYRAEHGYGDSKHNWEDTNAIKYPHVEYNLGLHDSIQLTEFIRQLKECKMWPIECISFRSIEANCQDLTTKFQNPRAMAVNWLEKSERAKGCRACEVRLEDSARKLATDVRDAVKGLCLDCMKHPEEEGGNCRIAHD